MIGTVAAPTVRGDRTTPGSTRPLWFHALGTTAGGALVGAALGVVSRFAVPDSVPAWSSVSSLSAFLAGAAIVLLLRERDWLTLPLPERRRQVPHSWRFWRSQNAAAFSYGLGLGVGILTFVVSPTFYLVALWALLARDPVAATVVFALFGATRGGLVTVVGRSFVVFDDAVAFSDRLLHSLIHLKLVNTIALGALATLLAGVAIAQA